MARDEVRAGPQAAVTATAAEHERIVEAQHRLQTVLARATSGRQRDWTKLVNGELERLLTALQEHVESAERDGGLLTEIENAMLAINDGIVALLKDHRRLLSDCQALISSVNQCTPGANDSLAEIRKAASSLMSDIQVHQTREADLMQEVFTPDIDAG